MELILAEAVSIDGGLVAALLAILLVVAATVIAAMVAGVFWAKRAARGSSPALAGFLVVAWAEAVLAVIGLGTSEPFFTTVFGIAFVVHVCLYAYERTTVAGATSTDGDPPPAQ